MTTTLEQFSSNIFPYYVSSKGVEILWEMKSDDYWKPHFNNGLCPFGGNWLGPESEQKSPYDLLATELKEEFHIIEEYEDNLNRLFHEKVSQKDLPFLINEKGFAKKIKDMGIKKAVQEIPEILLKNVKYSDSYIFTLLLPPRLNKKVFEGSSLFLKKLDKEEYIFIKELITRCEGTITTDNLKYKGSKTLFVPVKILEEHKICWGREQALIYLLKEKKIPGAEDLPDLKSLETIRTERMTHKLLINMQNPKGPTFQDFENLGYQWDIQT